MLSVVNGFADCCCWSQISQLYYFFVIYFSLVYILNQFSWLKYKSVIFGIYVKYVWCWLKWQQLPRKGGTALHFLFKFPKLDPCFGSVTLIYMHFTRIRATMSFIHINIGGYKYILDRSVCLTERGAISYAFYDAFDRLTLHTLTIAHVNTVYIATTIKSMLVTDFGPILHILLPMRYLSGKRPSF